MDDPYFDRAVVYICEHNNNGAMGLIINMPTDLSVLELLTRMDFQMANQRDYKKDQMVLSGGPVSQDRGFIVHTKTAQSFLHSYKITDDIMLTTSGDVLDIGCGAGVIGSYIQKHHPKTKLVMTDIHAMALKSAQRTLRENQLQGTVLASDVFSHVEGKFDLIISNPPFHDGIDTAYTAVNELIKQTKWHLKAGGELRIVANAFLPYPNLLDSAFGKHEVVAKSTKFKVYSARN